MFFLYRRFLLKIFKFFFIFGQTNCFDLQIVFQTTCVRINNFVSGEKYFVKMINELRHFEYIERS